ncbi:MAG: polyamine aminopropyltransferase [Flavobacteriaceae bacterium]|nr:polyamine aminopropyltransferase [Flavobacteriaceae bacterium]
MALKKDSSVLKAAIFATGFSGIVAEYILSTLATYFIGNAVLQWTMIVSLMLFCMGLGSRLSKYIPRHLVWYFLLLELFLSMLVAFSSLMVYSMAAVSAYYGLLIYGLSMLLGLLIGLEIPLVMRINETYEDLTTNVSAILEKDYYGSLLGGMFFAFVGLPILGLTYTPFVLGFVNLGVAILVFFRFRSYLPSGENIKLQSLLGAGVLFLILGLYFSNPIIQWGEQSKYKDKVVFAEQSKYQKIVMTQWKDDFWLYLNGNLQFCSIDEVMYHEPLVHPIMQLHPMPQRVLVLGGGDGCAVRELLKYSTISQVDLVDLDPAMTQLGKENQMLASLNKGSMHSKKLQLFHQDAYRFLEEERSRFYDIIIVDLPDPRSVELGRMYSYEFYNICKRKLRKNGMIITQAGSPYYATRAYRCIEKTMASAGFTTLAMHNQILSMGQWGWILGSKTPIDKEQLKRKAQQLKFEGIETKWLQTESMQLLTSFGKHIIFERTDSVAINKIHDPVLHRYYLEGNWELY